MDRIESVVLFVVRTVARLVWFIKLAVLSAIIGTAVAVGMVIANYFGTNEYGGIDFQMNLVTEMVGVWASTCVTVLVVDRLYRMREIENEKRRLLQEITMGENVIAKRAIFTLRVNKWLAGQSGLLKKAYLAGAELQEADLRGSNLNQAVLHSANLHRANLTNADLRGATLGNADLRKCKLFGAYLAEAQIDGGEVEASSVLPQLTRLTTEILGGSVQRLEAAMQELATRLETQKELKQEIEVTIAEQKQLIAEWEELERKSADRHGSEDDLTATLQADIQRLKSQLSDQETIRSDLKGSISSNEENYKTAANLIIYGSESIAAKLDKAILPDGTQFTEGMTPEALHRFTNPTHEEFEATLCKVNQIRKDMGHPILD